MSAITRREILKTALGAGASLLAAPMINRGRYRVFAGSHSEYSARAIEITGRATVIDMLCLLTLDFGKQAKWFRDPATFTTSDLRRFKDSGINVLHPNTWELAAI